MSTNESELPAPSLDIDENISSTSSTSSFVPIDQHHVQDAIQVINEEKAFNSELLEYIKKSTPSSITGNNYHIISVFGSQSTGKSTLLNNLFNTNFDVMDETRRQQTTKGIWMAYSPLVSNSKQLVRSSKNKYDETIFVMDVEGTDGRERGEDQDFERKAALFALSTSEILIINIWETQIGLYQGANMGLLKTVFEVNLTLFGKTKLKNNEQQSNHKVLLLFVIRDHIGVTPKDNLAQTITQDLVAMWSSLNKPPELSHLRFEDFFDITFHTLGHKVLQPDKFIDDIKLLGDRVIDNSEDDYLFKKEYHHNIPIDGWTMYAESCWNQIDNNKDLDLPTQQILVAKFKCDEIASIVYEEFLIKFQEHFLSKVPKTADDDKEIDYQDLGLSFIDIRNDVLENYDISASKYNKSIYQQKKATLSDKLDSKFKEIFEIHSNHLLQSVIKNFTTTLSSGKRLLPGKNFQEGVNNFTRNTIEDFETKLKHISLEGQLSTSIYSEKLVEKLSELVSKQQLVELNNIVNKSIKKLTTGLGKIVTFELGDLREETWDNILSRYKQLSDEAIFKYKVDEGYDFGLGTDNSTNEIVIETIKYRAWVTFYELIHRYISKDNVLRILQDRFDDKFRYDENGLPKLYQNGHELETSFNNSKSYAMKVFPILTIAKLTDDLEIIPEYDIFDLKLKKKYGSGNIVITEDLNSNEFEDDDSDDEDLDEPLKFSEILSESDKLIILNKFKKEVDAKYVETKRSLIQHVTQIPYYIYLIIVILGWNEFMAIIRNPVFFTLLLLLSAGGYVMYQLNLLRPAMLVAQRMFEESVDIAKQKIRDFVIDEEPTPQQHGRNLDKMRGSNKRRSPEVESYEMENLD